MHIGDGMLGAPFQRTKLSKLAKRQQTPTLIKKYPTSGIPQSSRKEKIKNRKPTCGLKVLFQPQMLRESLDHVPLELSSTSLDFDFVTDQSSTSFTYFDDPLLLPASFSVAAFCHLAQRMRNPSVREAFSKLGLLVEIINERLCPEDEHLQLFFRLAQFLEFKMYVRREFNFPGWPPTPCRRFRMECYVFDDRREYIASISLLPSQLRTMAKLFPGARQNLRFVDNAFELTPMPSKLTNILRVVLEAMHARPLYELLGELTLDYARPQAAVFKLPGSQTGIEN
ncbi:uncharacterized protein LOC110177909 isoform X2 [Drosophila serrata]|uniref:uncharacterized protein LOC110177909 isoform X2 n=1 Tax=Drosophila serrata TaxID=7274 RepID=UPI000A1D1939|nr:uncharacterized protein LOC110177909 isoform X2 [Drosophila serrata]